MSKLFRKVFDYIKPIWSDSSGEPSIRGVLALAFSVDLIVSIHKSVNMVVSILKLFFRDKTIDAQVVTAISANLAQITIILGIEAGIITALLSLKTYQNIQDNKTINNGSDTKSDS